MINIMEKNIKQNMNQKNMKELYSESTTESLCCTVGIKHNIVIQLYLEKIKLKKRIEGFTGGPVVKNPPCNTGSPI